MSVDYSLVENVCVLRTRGHQHEYYPSEHSIDPLHQCW